nr:MFS transporter [Mesorhizobium sp. B2-3-12]
MSLIGLSVTLFMPMLIRRFARRWVYTAGACLLAIGSLFFVTHTLAGQLAGMLCRVMGASALSITLNLYIMDHIRKTDFMQAESLRMAWSMVAWTCGPTLGIFLYAHFGIYAAHGAVAVFAIALLALFWFYRLSDNPSIRPGKTRPANPLANIGRFVAQPRLRLAWLIAFGRSCFWTTFLVYGPLFMVITGQGDIAGGLLVSAGNALLFMAIFWGKAGKRFGGRRTMTFAYFAMSAALLAAGTVGAAAPLLTGAFLLCGAFFTIALDALGSTAFMRSVRSYERAQMAAVYRTYLDFSELTPPLVCSVVLAFFGLGSVFVTLSLLAAFCGFMTWRYLPKSL